MDVVWKRTEPVHKSPAVGKGSKSDSDSIVSKRSRRSSKPPCAGHFLSPLPRRCNYTERE
jgi:hypothetical protein